MVQIVPDS